VSAPLAATAEVAAVRELAAELAAHPSLTFEPE
jgi:hypothetical protein